MIIDLRSDTVTRPTKEMLDAIFKAKVGDDVFGEDNAVLELEQKAATAVGMQAALFCPSGTMTNQIAIKILTNAPGEVICDQTAHVYQYEGGGISFNSGLSTKLLVGDRGILNAEMIANNINPDDVHKAETQLVCLENTCNRGGGSYYSLPQIESIYQLCHTKKLKLHLDGARLFNATVAGQQDTKEYGRYFDTISLCLSKGLGAPVGSILAGSKELIAKARRIRKLFGGGMRQAGYLAAAGSYAIDHHVDRLKDDHQLAKQIEQLLESQSYVSSILPVDTNIVVFKLNDRLPTKKFLSKLNAQQIKAVAFGPQTIRFVTHLDVTQEMLNKLEAGLKSM